jgi:hypothetical protein
LEAIAKCSKLEYLDVSGSHTKCLDRGVASLSALVHLRELHVVGVCAGGLRPLTALPHLEVLTVRGYHLDNNPKGALDCLAPLTTLRRLGLRRRRYPWSEMSVLWTVVCANALESLHVWYARDTFLRHPPGAKNKYIDLGNMFLKTKEWVARAKATCYRRAVASS